MTGLAELLGLKDHKKIILPVGLILPAMSMVVHPNISYGMNWILLGAVPAMVVLGLLLPVLLLIIFFQKTAV